MSLIERLKTIVGEDGLITDAVALEPHCREWRGVVFGKAAMLVAPSTSAEVAEVVRICAEKKVGIVAQGGNTGMCGGAVPDDSGSQIILSLARMNRIRSIDVENESIEVEAGCILQDVQAAAKTVGRFFPLSLGAEGSCQIGGNLATNAGGINVLRYGTARAQVLGMEVVLADGTILDGLRSIRKDTAGYDLKQLFVGSEGTLGVITAAVLRLYPDPGERHTALVAIGDSSEAVSLLAKLRSGLGDRIEAFELISKDVAMLLRRHIPDAGFPIDERYPWYILIDVALTGGAQQFESALLQEMQHGAVLDAVIAKSIAESAALWRSRHAIPEAERLEGKALKHDISVPISKIATFLERGDSLLARVAPNATVFAFGHVGDGNLHYNVGVPEGIGDSVSRSAAITSGIYDLVSELGGSFCAEHGVGVTKRSLLPLYRSPAEIALMKALKSTLDPQDILNPGKVI